MNTLIAQPAPRIRGNSHCTNRNGPVCLSRWGCLRNSVSHTLNLNSTTFRSRTPSAGAAGRFDPPQPAGLQLGQCATTGGRRRGIMPVQFTCTAGTPRRALPSLDLLQRCLLNQRSCRTFGAGETGSADWVVSVTCPSLHPQQSDRLLVVLALSVLS